MKTAMKPFFLSEAPRGKERPQKPKVVANRAPGKQTKIEVCVMGAADQISAVYLGDCSLRLRKVTWRPLATAWGHHEQMLAICTHFFIETAQHVR